MKRKIFIILLILMMILSIFPYAMLIHGEEQDNNQYHTQESLNVYGYQDPLLNGKPKTISTYTSAYFKMIDGEKRFYNGNDKQEFGNHPKEVIDISKWQGQIDFEEVQAAGIDGVIIRVGFGVDNIDEYFNRNITECNRLGIPYGLYLYSYAYDENFAKREATSLLNTLNKYDLSNLRFPIYYDLENFDTWIDADQNYRVCNPPEDAASYERIVKKFIDTFKGTDYYNKIHLYSNRSRFQDIMNSEYLLSLASWVAEYDETLDFNNQYYNGPKGWQFSDTGSVAGIKGTVDLNVFSDYFYALEPAFLADSLQMYETTVKKAKYESIDGYKDSVTFTSSNTKVCTVDAQGYVRAKSVGTATVKMKNSIGKVLDTITIQVFAKPIVNNLKIRQTDYTIVELSWDSYIGATSYDIYVSEDDRPFEYLCNAKSTTKKVEVTKLVPYSKVAFKIKAKTNIDHKFMSEIATKQLSIPPSGTVEARQITPTSIEFTYSKVKEAVYYDIYRATTITGTYRKRVRTSQNTFIDKGLVPHKYYYYKVRSVGTERISNFTLPYSLYTVLDAPNFTLNNQNKVQINVKKSIGSIYYQVQYRKKGESGFKNLITLSNSNLSYTHKKAKNGLYEYRVRGYRIVDGKRYYSKYSPIQKVQAL